METTFKEEQLDIWTTGNFMSKFRELIVYSLGILCPRYKKHKGKDNFNRRKQAHPPTKMRQSKSIVSSRSSL